MMRDFTTDFDCITAIMLTEGNYASTVEEYMQYVDNFSLKYHFQVD